MKKKIRLTESQLNRVIRKSIKKALNEGSYNTEVYRKWLDIKDAIGADAMLDEIWNITNADELEEIVNYFAREYNI